MIGAAVLPFGGFGTAEMILVFVVVVLLTGGKTLPALGRSLGERARDLARSVTRGLPRGGRSEESDSSPPNERSEGPNGPSRRPRDR